ncbi:PREDICTED: uncharacterized protein LOC104603058 isoform X2 [Nelumbo nucifera]|uniref:Uncharacterized protein LOC104603058 isoform X2 n=1 Tax=Nelumbo nucifera TaxID=4432 RepID=A0A1U8ARC7_NELNU|nr:PREDICTED: uncharacterized protein LOC104603058 isoform X2 [Nelumbo nucifera]
MASLSSSPLVSNPQWRTNSRSCRFCTSHYFLRTPSSVFLSSRRCQGLSRPIITSQLCTQELVTIDRSALVVAEAFSEEQLWAAACLRVRSFNEFQESYGVQDHKRYLAEREFEALKERIAGKRIGFRRVSCINATLPLSETSNFSDDLCSACKGIGADLTRAYLSNVCVAKELHRNGVGYAVVAKAKELSQEWGITDLYVHVAIDNEPARKLYIKSGFVYENDEPAWQARFLDRPRRILLWTAIP